jgi:glycosyltransferase involved in cell wall biosynthesis
MMLLSVGIPVYDGEKYLAEALESLLAQSFKEIEIVISDNASTDSTPEICRAYQAKDKRIRYVRNEQNIGAALNFNRVVELSGAPLFHGGACDDLYAPLFLERCVNALDRDPGLVLTYSRTMMIDEKGQPLLFDRHRNCYLDSFGDFLMEPIPPHIAGFDRPEIRFRQVLWEMGWALPLSGVIRKDALLRTSLYGNYYGADKVLLAELALHGRFHQVNEDLFAKRVHQGGTHYKTTRERAEHESKGGGGIPPQALMIRDYTKMVLAADMSVRQRLHCMVTVGGMARRREAWRRLLVPGPDNYFGLSLPGR